MTVTIGRRELLAALGGAVAAWPLAARAQQGQRNNQIRIGFLAAAVPTPAMLSAFRDALRERGYVEGQNLSITDRWPQGSFGQISDIAAELVRSNVDIIMAWGTPAALAAKAATTTIPIVMLVGDPVGMGLVRSLARPGGNITGFVNLAPDLSAKQVQLLVDVIPQIRRVGIVRNPSNPAVTSAAREAENAIRGLGLEFHTVDAQLPAEFENAFARLSAEGVKGVVVAPDPSVIEHRSMIAVLAPDFAGGSGHSVGEFAPSEQPSRCSSSQISPGPRTHATSASGVGAGQRHRSMSKVPEA
jgi:putative ABC transport system substrate-binding protein